MSDLKSSASGIYNNSNFQILEEAEDFVIVNKPAPLLVHPSVPGNPPTLLDGLNELLAFEIANGARLSIINRLDRETSGVVIVAKNKDSARRFGIAMQERRIEKEYLAIAAGHPVEDHFVVVEPLLRAGEVEQSAIWVRQIPHPDGTPAHTAFEVIERSEVRGLPVSVIRARPTTGRMHQIRVHLKHAGHPIIGDKIYTGDGASYLEFIETGWSEKLAAALHIRRHALHCTRMAVPEIGEWHSPLPEDLDAFLTGD